VILERIYQLIQPDMVEVEALIRSTSRVDFQYMAELLEYSLEAGGKRIRPALTLLSGQFYDYDTDYIYPMAVAVELLHTATLIHDDAIDKSAVRRGRSTINAVWGEDQAILLGDYLFARAGETCASTGNVRVIRLFSQTLATISSGEIRQAYDAFRLEQTREDYFYKIGRKTASLFHLSTESGAVLSGAPESAVQALVEYGYNLGIAFQIVDDILDFIGTREELGKPVGSDLMQGTLTLPSMLLLERYPENNPVQRIFQQSGGAEEVQRAIEMVRDSGVAQECYKLASEYVAEGCRGLDILPDVPARSALRELAEYVVGRRE
jgi:geranylgeranyl pyrophosphate synthase